MIQHLKEREHKHGKIFIALVIQLFCKFDTKIKLRKGILFLQSLFRLLPLFFCLCSVFHV